MPGRSLKPCSAPGCGGLTAGKYCGIHRSYRTQDKTQRDRLYTQSRWRRIRARYLHQHPLCAHCLADGRTTAATEVDHIQPHRGDMARFWDQSNYQALCKSHHSAKTYQETLGT